MVRKRGLWFILQFFKYFLNKKEISSKQLSRQFVHLLIVDKIDEYLIIVHTFLDPYKVRGLTFTFATLLLLSNSNP